MSETPSKKQPGQDADSEGFLSRWSRRKTMSRQGAETADADADAVPQPTPESEPVADDVQPVPPATVDGAAADSGSAVAPAVELPPIEALDENSDYSAFMQSGVSADMQRKALRKLFTSPKFNVRDGLDDYDLDYSNPQPLGNVITAEMRRRVRKELERMAALDTRDDSQHELPAAVAADTATTAIPEPDADAESDDDRTETA